MKSSLCSLLILLTLPCLAQTGSVKGNISCQNEALEFASIVVLSTQNQKLTKGTLSDRRGDYLLQDLPFGSYNIKVSYLSMQPIDTIITLSTEQPIAQLDFKLKTNSAQLREVTITTTHQKETIGKRSFDFSKEQKRKLVMPTILYSRYPRLKPMHDLGKLPPPQERIFHYCLSMEQSATTKS